MTDQPTACSQWQEDLAGWLMAQLPPDREEQLAAHLLSCPVCSAEAESLLAVAAVTLTTDPDGPLDGTELPSPELVDRILASVASERRPRRLARAGLALLATAAIVVAAVVALATDGAPGRLRGEEVIFAVVPEGVRAEAVVADDDGGTLVQLIATGLDPAVTYALWLTPPGGGWRDRVAAGTFRPNEGGAVDVRLRCALPADEYGRVWATTPDGEIALDTE